MVQGQGAGLTIGALAKAGGVGVETIRYYQRLGLLRVPAPPSGIRRYDTDDLRRLRFIRSIQRAGFTLEQAGELLTLDAADDRARARSIAAGRLAALDQKIAELNDARAALARLAKACDSSSDLACPILVAFENE